MMTYVTAFIFYTLAMVGILLVAFIVYKKTMETNKGENKGLIKILDSTPIGNKKMLLVVKVKNERFLIASGVEHTTFLSKLENENPKSKNQNDSKQTIQESLEKSVLDEIYEQGFMPIKKETRYDDTRNTRTNEVQRQFKELYEKEEEPIIPNKGIVNRKEVVKHLLKSIHSENQNDGSRF